MKRPCQRCKQDDQLFWMNYNHATGFFCFRCCKSLLSIYEPNPKAIKKSLRVMRKALNENK